MNQVFNYLTSVLSTEDSGAIRALRRRDEACFQKVLELVRHWTPEAAIKDWPTYCAASRATRSGILQIVADEKQLLYPLLYREN